MSHVFRFTIVAVLICCIGCTSKDKKNAPSGKKSNNDTSALNIILQHLDKTSDTDSIHLCANQALSISGLKEDGKLYGTTLKSIAEAYLKANQRRLADSFIRMSVENLIRGPYEEELGDAYSVYGMTSDPSMDPNATGASPGYFEHWRKMDSLVLYHYSLSKNQEKLGAAYVNIGLRKETEGNFTAALEKYKEALVIYDGIGYKKMQRLYCSLGGAYARTGNYEEGVRNSFIAVQMAEAQKDSSTLELIYSAHAGVLVMLKQLDSAAIYYRKALEIGRAIKSGDTLASLLNIASTYQDKKQYSNELKALDQIDVSHAPIGYPVFVDYLYLELYIATRDYGKAEKKLERLLKADSKFELSFIKDYCQIGAADYYLATRQFQKIYPLAKKYIAQCEDKGKGFELSRPYKWLFLADSNLGRYQSAITNYQNYTIVRDSVSNANKSKQIEQVKTAYEAEKKEQKIQLLTKESQLNKVQLSQVTTTRNITIGGTFMLLLLLGVSYNRYRLKQRSNRQLEIKQQEIYSKNESLRRLVEEKEWLIKEIHHRVKNNLQVVMSLLHSQTLYLDNEAAVAAIQESKSRMYAMSLIHQKLYQSETVSSMNMPEYLAELVDYLHDSIDPGQSLHFERRIEQIDLDVAQAIPVGLILNEAITNAIKYAYPKGTPGTICIAMCRKPNDIIAMSVSDGGIGLPDNFDFSASRTMGMSLMKGLAKQLDGTFNLANSKGLKIEIEFPYRRGRELSEITL